MSNSTKPNRDPFHLRAWLIAATASIFAAWLATSHWRASGEAEGPALPERAQEVDEAIAHFRAKTVKLSASLHEAQTHLRTVVDNLEDVRDQLQLCKTRQAKYDVLVQAGESIFMDDGRFVALEELAARSDEHRRTERQLQARIIQLEQQRDVASRSWQFLDQLSVSMKQELEEVLSLHAELIEKREALRRLKKTSPDQADGVQLDGVKQAILQSHNEIDERMDEINAKWNAWALLKTELDDPILIPLGE